MKDFVTITFNPIQNGKPSNKVAELEEEIQIIQDANISIFEDNKRLEEENSQLQAKVKELEEIVNDKNSELHGAFLSNDKLSAKISDLKKKLQAQPKQIVRFFSKEYGLNFAEENKQNANATKNKDNNKNKGKK